MTWAAHLFWEYLYLAGSVLLIMLVFSALERLAPAEREQPLSGWLFNVAYTPVIIAVIFLLSLLFNPVFSLVTARTGGGLLPTLLGEEAGALAHLSFAFAYFVAWDLCQYLLHRLQHSVPFLWETHKFHHSETALNSAAQSKTHALSHLLSLVFYLPVVVLFGPQTPHFVATFLMFRTWAFVNHANVRVGFGPLTPLITGPQYHRIHHSLRAEHYDKNFAAFFPFIDRLFGTYYRPRAGEYPPTGLVGETAGALTAATIEPLLAWRRMILGRLGRLRGKAVGGAG
jgi:sterol desaturase/sphingolipid hydroxylase (fatty acid hydroxylase superfamily)